MRTSIWIASVLATFAVAAPTYPGWTNAVPQDIQALSTYFNTLASKVDQSKNMSPADICDLSKAQMPIASPTSLPPPSPGLTLKHVAVGRGTQNYTCGTNSSAAPVAIGALATLFNTSCVAASFPDVLASLPNFALQYDLNPNEALPNIANLMVSGHHLFLTPTTPFFDLDTTSMTLGEAPCSKNNTVNAPPTAPKGQGGSGDGAVPWLKLLTKDGATGNLEEIYRLNTAGGNPPLTCEGMPASFEVQYSAEYWFYES